MDDPAPRAAGAKRGAAARLGFGAWVGAAAALLIIYLADRFWIRPWLATLPYDTHGRPEEWLVFLVEIVVVPVFVVMSGWFTMRWARSHWKLVHARPHRATFALYSCIVLVIALLGVPSLTLEGALVAASIAIGLAGFLANSPSRLQTRISSTPQ